MDRLEDQVKEWDRDYLEYFVIKWNDFHLDFEKFMKEKLGEQTYRNLIHEYCQRDMADWLKNVKINEILYMADDEEELN